MSSRIQTAKQWAHKIKRDVLALWIAARDTRTPISAKITAGTVAAYALSPIDLVPDFIPVLGYIDDLLIVPAGILLAVRLIAANLMVEFRARAELQDTRPVSRAGLLFVVLVWLAAVAPLACFGWPTLREPSTLPFSGGFRDGHPNPRPSGQIDQGWTLLPTASDVLKGEGVENRQSALGNKSSKTSRRIGGRFWKVEYVTRGERRGVGDFPDALNAMSGKTAPAS